MRAEVQNIASAVGWSRLLTRNEEMFAKEKQRNVWGMLFETGFRQGNQCLYGGNWDNHPRKKEITGAYRWYCLPLWSYFFSVKNARKVLPA